MRNRLSNAIRRFKRPGLQGDALGWVSYEPNFASLLVSDHSGIAEQSARTLRFLRSVNSQSYAFQNASPGSRVTFNTTATKIRISMFHNDLVNFTGDTNNNLSTGAILVDGVEVKTYKWINPWNETGIVNVELSLASGLKTVTIVWAYWVGFELRKIEINTGATISAPAARPTGKIAICGDSIAQGSAASKVTPSWAYLLAIEKTRQLVNLGNGGDQANANAALGLGVTGANIVIYMIGYNNFAGQTDPGTASTGFQKTVQDWITNARTAVGISVPIHVISPIFATIETGVSYNLVKYRDAVEAAVANRVAAGITNLFFISGIVTGMPNDSSQMSDGVHPNDAGSVLIKDKLKTLV